MKTLLLHIWSRLRTSFWFVPGLLVAAATLTGYCAIAFDRHFSIEILSTFPHLSDISAEGVRSLLSTAATSVLTLAGITFSSTLVALTLASSQYGGRLLRNFIRAVPNQVALGILLGNFVLCLIVMRSVRSLEGSEFIPHTAALLCFVATLGSLVTFIFFIHHIATSLQADNIVSGVYRELDEAIESHFPDEWPDDHEELEAEEEKHDWGDLDDEVSIAAPRSGYVQAIAFESLVAECARHDLRCRVLHRPGQFANAGTCLVAISGDTAGSLSDSERSGFLEAIILGRIRTAEQDFEYCLRQLVEVSLRALSPGINDPFTAMNCIDYLGAALAKVARRKLPKREFADGDGTQRVRSRPTLFSDLVGTAFHQIRQTAAQKTDIALRLLGSLGGIGASATLPLHATTILLHAELIADTGKAGAQTKRDAEEIDKALQRVRDRLRDSRAGEAASPAGD